MAPHKSVIINGRHYDAVTGLPIEDIPVTAPDKTPIKKPALAPAKKPVVRTNAGAKSADIAHSATVQRSKTLYKRASKKPAAPQKPILKRNTPGRHMDIARNTSVSRFAKHPEVKVASVTKAVTAPIPAPKPDKPAQVHPLAQRAMNKVQQKKNSAPLVAKEPTAKQVKDEKIAKALATPKAKSVSARKSKRDRKSFRRFLIIGAIVLALLTLLYAAWRMIPNISVSVAASQSGISATYPEYTPDGYSLRQPVTFSDGQVVLKFHSNSNENYYTVTQTRSSWDSSAVLDNVVAPTAGANYVTTKERGLTIYTYGNSAAWVNGGILYKIESKAPLSGDQIRRIATSL